MFDEIDSIMSYEDANDLITFESIKLSKSKVLYDGIFELIGKSAISKKSSILEFIFTFIDKNSSALEISGPYLGIFLEKNDADFDILYDILNVTKSDIKEVIKKCSLVSSSFKTLNNPLFFLLTGLTCVYGSLEDRASNDAKFACALLMAIRFYSSRQSHLWKYGCNKDVMEYTINNLNNKYIIKTSGSVLNMLRHLTLSNDETVGVDLRKTHDDAQFTYYISNLSTKVNNTLKNIFDEYLKNSKDKKYMGEVSDRYDDEKEDLKVLNNTSGEIINITNKVYNRLKTSPVNESILKTVTSITQLKVSSVKSTIEEIIDNETDKLKTLILNILQVYAIDPANSLDKIKSRYFIAYCTKIYKASNVNSEEIINIKKTLDEWIHTYGAKYIRLNREATLINFRKAIYLYIVYSIVNYV